MALFSFLGKIKIMTWMWNLFAITSSISMSFFVYFTGQYTLLNSHNSYTLSSNISSQSNSSKPKLSIAIIYSYNRNYLSEQQERKGLITQLWTLRDKYSLRIREYYIEALTTNIDLPDQRRQVDKIISHVNLNSVDYFFTVGPVAFEHAVSKLVDNNCRVLAVAAQCKPCFVDKLKTHPYNKLSISFRNTSVSGLFDIFDREKISFPKHYILCDNSIPSLYLKQTLIDSLETKKITPEIINLTTLQQLRLFLRDKAKPHSIFFIIPRILLDTETGKYLPTQNLFSNFQYYNTDSLEVVVNPRLVCQGYSIGVGPTCYSLGSVIGSYFVSSIASNKSDIVPKIFEPNQIYACNELRLRQLGFNVLSRTVLDYFTIIKGSYNVGQLRHEPW